MHCILILAHRTPHMSKQQMGQGKIRKSHRKEGRKGEARAHTERHTQREGDRKLRETVRDAKDILGFLCVHVHTRTHVYESWEVCVPA